MLLMIGALPGTTPAAAQQASATNPTVTVGVTPSIDMVLMIIAVKKDFLQKEGLNARLQLFDTSPAALQGVVAERADITNNTEPPQLAARARGGKIVQVMTGYLSGKQNGLVVDGDLIKKPADLIGKSVGVQRGSGANYHLAWFLQHNDICKWIKCPSSTWTRPDQIPAMAREDIQAFFSWEPFLTKAVETGPKAKIFSRTIDDDSCSQETSRCGRTWPRTTKMSQ